ncbi:hypothetical protein BDF20DRAFT_896870 [Mycotypha africana]|uniref:uncharacterized protein n=1 Tax=Mycotypha africana TaxID=64632 RepID=UPI002301B9DC|nr:uncharacterized protein BDF20DRAFT_896870 [Mycotypha africana]KAI8968525.1 hypothetical protein BDF20DRAFT_896870 [Mycotypha africana]
MSVYHAVPTTTDRYNNNVIHESMQVTKKPARSRPMLAGIMLAICIIAFVIQTELAQYVQRSTNYAKPYFILYISHSCYIFMLPLQFFAEYFSSCHHSNKEEDGNEQESRRYLSIHERLHDVIQEIVSCVTVSLDALQYRHEGNSGNPSDDSSSNKKRILLLLKLCLILAVLLTLPSYIWYVSVNLTSMSNLTAIYNTGCFFAYLFNILMLHDRLVLSKGFAVILSMLGVLTMAIWADSSSDEGDSSSLLNGNSSGGENTNSWLGIAVATSGAAFYGFYEVYYKKYASPAQPTILFANIMTGIIGIATFIFLWLPLPLLHWSGVEPFELPEWTTFKYILLVASMSVIYNATFMAVIALVNPVYAAVGVMLTVPAVAVTDVLLTGVMVPTSTVIGSILILVSFFVLNKQVLNEEKETAMIDHLEEGDERE